MRKIFFLIFMSFIYVFGYSQSSYQTNFGNSYTVGDTIYLGQPKGYVQGVRNTSTKLRWVTLFSSKKKLIRNMNFVKKFGVVTKIDSSKPSKIFFTMFNKGFYVFIEEALKRDEVIIPTKKIKEKDEDKYDKIKKLKELLDIGAITREEYDVEKKKLLNQN